MLRAALLASSWIQMLLSMFSALPALPTTTSGAYALWFAASVTPGSLACCQIVADPGGFVMLYVRHSLAPELRSQVLLLESSSQRQGLHPCTFAMLFPTARVRFPTVGDSEQTLLSKCGLQQLYSHDPTEDCSHHTELFLNSLFYSKSMNSVAQFLDSPVYLAAPPLHFLSESSLRCGDINLTSSASSASSPCWERKQEPSQQSHPIVCNEISGR